MALHCSFPHDCRRPCFLFSARKHLYYACRQWIITRLSFELLFFFFGNKTCGKNRDKKKQRCQETSSACKYTFIGLSSIIGCSGGSCLWILNNQIIFVIQLHCFACFPVFLSPFFAYVELGGFNVLSQQQGNVNQNCSSGEHPVSPKLQQEGIAPWKRVGIKHICTKIQWSSMKWLSV